MLRAIGWSVWAVLPIFALAFHFGPGQPLLKRELAIEQMSSARAAEEEANRLQAVAYTAQFETLAAREAMLQSSEIVEENDSEIARKKLDRLLTAEQEAYAKASDAWKLAAERYDQIETLLDGSKEANQIRLLRGRALVRAGEVFNGIEELQATLDAAMSEQTAKDEKEHAASSDFMLAAREELAAAHYFGARLLREEGRSADVWRQVSETSRQQFRYLAEQTAVEQKTELAQNLQRNVERVLDLEQQDRSELVGRPIPKDSPRARRPGDGEPAKRPGNGRRPGDQPGNGATGMMEIGDGW